MSANNVKWVRLGDYIEPCDERNSLGYNYPFYGINKDKTFMPTIANTNELDNTKYKIVNYNNFVFSGMQTGRDICIRIALYDQTTPILISPAYTTFKIKDTSAIIPQYLFIQFNRLEMDRYGWFLSDSSVRSNLDWDRFCDIEIPLPEPKVQQELVDTYNGLKSIAEQNEALIEPLSKACEAFIVDCKNKYPEVELGKYIEQCVEKNYNNIYGVNNLRGVTSDSVFDLSKADTNGLSFGNYKIVRKYNFAYNPSRINLGSIALNKENTFIVSPMYVVFNITNNQLLPEFLNLYFARKEFQRSTLFYAMGSVRDTFDFNLMQEVKIPLPPLDVQQSIVNVYNCLEEAKKIAKEAREKLKTLCPALVQRAANS